MVDTKLLSSRSYPDNSGLFADTFETGSGPIDIPSRAGDGLFRLVKVFGHFSAPLVEDLLITLASRLGSEFETLIAKVDAGAVDFYFIPDGLDIYANEDVVKVTSANSGSATFGISIVRNLLEKQL